MCPLNLSERAGASDCGRKGRAPGAGHVRDGRPADRGASGAGVCSAARAALCERRDA